MQHVVFARPLAKYPVFNEFSKNHLLPPGPGPKNPPAQTQAGAGPLAAIPGQTGGQESSLAAVPLGRTMASP